MYANGYGVAKDAIEAVRWYRMSAEHGEAFAEYALGEAHERGEGAPRDLRAARRWYQAAADHGNTNAQAALQRLTANPE
jgi:TPR repeat protein